MKAFLTEKILHPIFEIGVWLKGLDGLLETSAGLLLLFVKATSLNRAFLILTQRELIEDPHNFITNYFSHFLQHLTPHLQLFAAINLLLHGLIKLFIVIGLLKNKLWVYPLSIWVLLAFIAYQIYVLAYRFSLLLLVLTILDVLIIWLIRHEYRYQRAKIAS